MAGEEETAPKTPPSPPPLLPYEGKIDKNTKKSPKITVNCPVDLTGLILKGHRGAEGQKHSLAKPVEGKIR